MLRGSLRVDLRLVREGLVVAFDFGVAPLEQITRLAEVIEHTVYEPGSLRAVAGRARFTLLNPPLRMGAFSSATIQWDGEPVDPARCTVETDGVRPARALSTLSSTAPLGLPVGARSRFAFPVPDPTSGEHRVRLELTSVAIPPRIWLEFADRVAADVPAEP